MSTMTLETALSAIDRSISTLREAGYPVQAAELSEARVPVARQFAQPAQAVDVGDAWRDLFWQVALELGCLPSTFVDGNSHVLCAARALSGEKAGLVGDGVELFIRDCAANSNGVWDHETRSKRARALLPPDKEGEG